MEGHIVSAHQDEHGNVNGRVEWFEQHRLDVDAEVHAYRAWLAARAAGKKKAAAALRRRKNKIATASRRQQGRA